MRCTLTSDQRVDRGQRWSALGSAHVVKTQNGLRLSFPAEAEQEVRALAQLERECCAFADWQVTAQNGRAVLDVTAHGDAVAAVQSLFGSLRK
jgi:hypothetical protein